VNLPATLPPGPAPTIPTLRGEFAKRDNLIAEATRRGPVGPGGAYCRVHLTVDVAMSAAVDYLAYGNWVADNDDRGMYTPGGSTKATITIPATGVWLIHYHAIYMGSATDSTGIDYIINNGTSIARDAKRCQRRQRRDTRGRLAHHSTVGR
jgi:hypothetical protein